ncbi:hypothetical protein D3C73_1233240 [compost metagenome]
MIFPEAELAARNFGQLQKAQDQQKEAGCGQQINTRPAECVIQSARNDLKAELMRDIRQLVAVEGMYGVVKHGLVLQHVTTELDMPERIRIIIGRPWEQSHKDNRYQKGVDGFDAFG